MSAVAILIGDTPAPCLDPAVAELLMVDLDIIRCEPGTLAAALAMAHCDVLMRKMTGPQVARAIAIMDGAGWSRTVH